MKAMGELASNILGKMRELVDCELLVSTPGIKEPGSNFMWASSFRAPVGIDVIGEEVTFNLFLPEGAEHDNDKKLFFNTVNAKLVDGLWHARRNMKDLSESYASVIRMALTSFRSVILDQSFIEEGRYYAHFIFNQQELPAISNALISLAGEVRGYRIEYIRKLRNRESIFNEVEELGTVSTIVLVISKKGNENVDRKESADVPFIMAKLINQGVKTIAKAQESGIPQLLSSGKTSEIKDRIVEFDTSNNLITDLVRNSSQNFIIIYGLFGYVKGESIFLMLPIQRKQIGAFLQVLNDLREQYKEWDISIPEIERFEPEN